MVPEPSALDASATAQEAGERLSDPAVRAVLVCDDDGKLVVEGANGPTSIEADAILGERGIPILPDVLTNAGGVTVSYFEWVQDLGRLFWSRAEIRAKLADQLGDAFDRVWRLAEEQGISLRSAALVAGIREVAGALTARGIYP